MCVYLACGFIENLYIYNIISDIDAWTRVDARDYFLISFYYYYFTLTPDRGARKIVRLRKHVRRYYILL